MQKDLSITREAAKRGILSSTVFKRIHDGASRDEALARGRARIKRRIPKEDEIALLVQYVNDYKRDNSGMPPSLLNLQQALPFVGSSGYARHLIDRASDQGLIDRTDNGKLTLPGERWLSGKENDALETITALLAGTENPTLQAALATLAQFAPSDEEREIVRAKRSMGHTSYVEEFSLPEEPETVEERLNREKTEKLIKVIEPDIAALGYKLVPL